ncbi:MAG: MarR family transcriptional regulator [Ruminococcaceae bacterium]|nr:MarR family transcriptional regulator [Oscillospiraceae bacterium]
MVGRFEVFTLGLSEIMSSWTKIASDEMKPFGLKGTYVIYLIALYKHPEGLTSANLSEMCNRDKAEVSRAIKALESKELIVRENTTVNGYRAKITLTEKGRESTKALRERVKLAVEKGGEGLSEKERDSFYSALEIISANLKKISREGL